MEEYAYRGMKDEDVNSNKVLHSIKRCPCRIQLRLLFQKRKIAFAAKTMRDVAVFTDKRILIADKQGITGKKGILYNTI